MSNTFLLQLSKVSSHIIFVNTNNVFSDPSLRIKLIIK